MSGRTAAVIPAAGRGERLGPGAPKALRTLGGLPLVVHAVKAVAASPLVDIVVVAAPEEALDEMRAVLRTLDVPAEVSVVAGGDTRVDSVARALLTLSPDVDIVLVHDAARPLVPVEVVTAVAQAVRDGKDAVIPVLPVVDTIKNVDLDGAVQATVDRDTLRIVQTPQGFRRELLQRAHAASDGAGITDDAGLVEALGYTVTTVPGHDEALKVTRPFDIYVAEAILARRRSGEARG